MADSTLYTSLQWATAARKPKLFNTEALCHDKASAAPTKAFSQDMLSVLSSLERCRHTGKQIMRAWQEVPGPDGMTGLGLLGMQGWDTTLPASRTVEHGAAGGCTGAWMLG